MLHIVDTTVKIMKSHAANLITICNLSFGGASIMATLNGDYNYSVLFIFIAAFLDRYDGKVARKLNQESELGKQLDSMSDIISFGIAPALLMYENVLAHFSFVGMMVTIIYMATGAFRLARFNITNSSGYFIGLPITVTGTILAFSYFLIPYVASAFYMFLFLIFSLLMISTFRWKKV